MEGEGGIQEGLNGAALNGDLPAGFDPNNLPVWETLDPGTGGTDPNVGGEGDPLGTDPNAALGANLWGVETLYGRRGVQRRYGEAADGPQQAVGPDTTPNTPDGGGGADPTGGGGGLGAGIGSGVGGVHDNTTTNTDNDNDPNNVDMSNRIGQEEIARSLQGWTNMVMGLTNPDDLTTAWESRVETLNQMLADGFIGQAQYESMMTNGLTRYNTRMTALQGTTQNAGNVLNDMLDSFDGITKESGVLAQQEDLVTEIKRMFAAGEIGENQMLSMIRQVETAGNQAINLLNNPITTGGGERWSPEEVTAEMDALTDLWVTKTPKDIAGAGELLEGQIETLTAWFENGNIGQAQFNAILNRITAKHSQFVASQTGNTNPNTSTGERIPGVNGEYVNGHWVPAEGDNGP